VGSGGTGVAEGTVTGLGSVIVDGQTYVETDAAVVAEDDTGTAQNADVKLGQRVRLVYANTAGADVASRVEVLAQLVGPVTQSATQAGVLKVMGQTVQTVGTSTQAQTVLAGVSDLAALAVGDRVEVHGSWLLDATTGTEQLVATRIEKRTDTGTVLLSGVVHGLTTGTVGSGLRWHLNGASGVVVQVASPPVGLIEGALVRLWLTPAAALVEPLQPLRTVVADLGTATTSDGNLRFSAQATSYNPQTRTLVVQGVALKLPASLVVDEDALVSGGYVTTQVSRQGGQLQVLAASVQSGGTALTRDIELKGILNGVDFTANPVLFTLRGQPVRALPAVLDAACLGLTAGDMSLQVQGRIPAGDTTVQASRVQCKLVSVPTAAATVEREGTVLSVDTAQHQLVLKTMQGMQTTLFNTEWDASTYFEKSPDALPGLMVEIEGIQNGSLLRIRRLRLMTGVLPRNH
jgi:hypothetical protein